MNMILKLKWKASVMLAWAVVSWHKWLGRHTPDARCSDIQQAYSQTSWGKDQLDDALLIDGMTDFSGGQQSFLRSTLIPANAYQKGQNIIVRDNYEARTRPGADKIVGGSPPGTTVALPANYANYTASVNLAAATSYMLVLGINEVGGSAVVGTQAFPMLGIGQTIQFTTVAATTLDLTIVAPANPAGAVTASLIQVSGVAPCLGLYYFDTPVYQQLLAAFNGFMWVYQGGSWAQTAYTPNPGRLAMAQGVDKMLISDALSPIVLYDGNTFTPQISAGNAPGPNDPPVGASILCFHQGCMFASGIPPADKSAQYGGTSIFADTVLVSNSLAIGAGQWNNLTRSFRVGNGDGQAVVAMASIQDQTLCCFKNASIWLVNTGSSPTPANFAADNAVAALSQGIGIVGRDAWCAYGNDLLFMASDGIRSVQRMQAAAGQWQLSAPISQPIQDVIQSINWAYAYQIVAIKYQEFAFFFVPTGNSLVNNTVIVYNGRLNSFAGTFTNWNGSAVVTTLFGNVLRLVWGGQSYDVNMWKDYADSTTDSTYTDNGAPYPSVLWTRSFQHNDFVLNKKPNNAILRFSAGNATINVSWIADFVDDQDWQVVPAPSGAILGVTTILPFKLSSVGPTLFQKSLRAAVSENEGYLALSTAGGWFWMRQLWVTAFAQPPKETS